VDKRRGNKDYTSEVFVVIEWVAAVPIGPWWS